MGTSGRLVVMGDVVYCIDTLATALYHSSTVEDGGAAGSGLCPAFRNGMGPDPHRRERGPEKVEGMKDDR